jgi:hypothetical protein
MFLAHIGCRSTVSADVRTGGGGRTKVDGCGQEEGKKVRNFVDVMNECTISRVHMLGQRCHLIGMLGVLEQNKIMRIQVHHLNVAISIK